MTRKLVATATVALCYLFATEAAHTEVCAGPQDRPAVCNVQAFAALGRARLQPVDVNAPLRLPVGETLRLELQAYDQFRRPFPTDRLAFGFETERCDDALEISQPEVGQFEFVAGGRRGDCRVWLWIPGDLNFEWPLVVRIEGRDRTGYTQSDAEFIAQRLYQGLLGRDPDPSGLAETAASIERGDLVQRIDTILRSREFANKVDRTTPQSILDRLYSGLLGRPVDPVGVRTYLSAIERGRISEVVMELLGSEEFETKLIRRDRAAGDVRQP